MGFQLKKRKGLLLTFLSWLIVALFSYILPDLFESLFSWYPPIYKHKALLIILMLLILIVLFAYKSYTPQPASLTINENKDIEKEQEKLLYNLSRQEKYLLNIAFMVMGTTVANLRYEENVITLVKKGVLIRLSENNDSDKPEPMQIAEWARIFFLSNPL